jgi:hypothetical protein
MKRGQFEVRVAFQANTAEPASLGRWCCPLEGERAKPEGASAKGRFGGSFEYGRD